MTGAARRIAALLIALAAAGASCGGGSRRTARAADAAGEPPIAERAAAPSRAEAAGDAATPDTRPAIVVLGDSLTAGLGLPVDKAYPSLLQQRVDQAGLAFRVVNAGVSGDTSAGGLSRLDWALDGDVRVLIVALGGNDGLRGLPPEELKKNLATIIERAQARRIAVILAGMEAPPNFGASYTAAFHAVYPELAAKYRVVLIPFLLDGVAGIERLNQADGIHPTVEGARIVAGTVWRALEPVLQKGDRPA